MTEYEHLMLRSQQVLTNHICNLTINEIRKASEDTAGLSEEDKKEKLDHLGEVAEFHQHLQHHLNTRIDKAIGTFLEEYEQNDGSATEH